MIPRTDRRVPDAAPDYKDCVDRSDSLSTVVLAAHPIPLLYGLRAHCTVYSIVDVRSIGEGKEKIRPSPIAEKRAVCYLFFALFRKKAKNIFLRPSDRPGYTGLGDIFRPCNFGHRHVVDTVHP